MSAIPLSEQPFPVVRATELDTTPDEQRWLIESLWMHSAVGLIGGSPKSLKTWLGLEMAVSVASGTACLDRFTVQTPGPALIYLAEDRLCTVRERLETLCAHRGLGLDTLDLHVITVPTLRLDTRVDVSRLNATIDSYRPKLLLLDPFVRLHKSDENSSQDIAMILASLREIQRRYDVAVVVVHHTRKNQRASQHGQTLRGSGDFHAWSDSALYLTRHKQDLQLTAEHRAAAAPKPWYLRLHDEPSYLTLVELDPHKDPPSLEQRVLQTLQQNSSPMHRNQLRTILAVNNTHLGDVLGALEQRGRVHRTHHGWTR